jgi:hypothetical protein
MSFDMQRSISTSATWTPIGITPVYALQIITSSDYETGCRNFAAGKAQSDSCKQLDYQLVRVTQAAKLSVSVSEFPQDGRIVLFCNVVSILGGGTANVKYSVDAESGVWIIVIIVIGIILCCATCIFCCMRARRRRLQREAALKQGQMPMQQPGMQPLPQPYAGQQPYYGAPQQPMQPQPYAAAPTYGTPYAAGQPQPYVAQPQPYVAQGAQPQPYANPVYQAGPPQAPSAPAPTPYGQPQPYYQPQPQPQ